MAITLDQAKVHVHVTDPARDTEVQLYLTQATALIGQYVGAQLATANPDVVDAATLKMLGHLYEHRGDDSASVFGPDAKVWEGISVLLMRTRDPAVS